MGADETLVHSLGELIRRVREGDCDCIEAFCCSDSFREYNAVSVLSVVYDCIPDDQKHRVVTDIYTAQNPPFMKKYVRDVIKFRPENYLADMMWQSAFYEKTLRAVPEAVRR